MEKTSKMTDEIRQYVLGEVNLSAYQRLLYSGIDGRKAVGSIEWIAIPIFDHPEIYTSFKPHKMVARLKYRSRQTPLRP